MLGLTFSSKLDWGSYIISIAITASKKIGALICSRKFLSPEVALYHTALHGILFSCLGLCSQLLLGFVRSDKNLLPVLNPSKCSQLKSSIGVNLVYAHLNWLNWFQSFILEGSLLVILIDCMIFLSSLLGVTRMSVSSFFPRTARHWNSLPIEYFSLTYDLNDFKSRINRRLLTICSS